MRQCHKRYKIRKSYDPKIDLIDLAGVKLTPSHYAYLKSQRAVTTVVPSASFRLRGDLVSRPIDEVMNEAVALKSRG